MLGPTKCAWLQKLFENNENSKNFKLTILLAVTLTDTHRINSPKLY